MPANTPRGYPYPLPTEPVAEGAQAIRNLAERIDAGPPESARMDSVAVQGIPNNVLTALAIQSVKWDTDAMTPPTGRLTIKTAGYYLVTSYVRWAAGGGGARLLILQKEPGAVRLLDAVIYPPQVEHVLVTVAPLAVNDYIFPAAYQNSGGPINIDYTADTAARLIATRIA